MLYVKIQDQDREIEAISAWHTSEQGDRLVLRDPRTFLRYELPENVVYRYSDSPIWHTLPRSEFTPLAIQFHKEVWMGFLALSEELMRQD